MADAETALGPVRLTGELARTCYQLRAFADIVDEGEFLGVVVNHPDDTATPARPDLRRYKVPLGVVAVYSASNFPFAFSVPGGDTASALTAGCRSSSRPTPATRPCPSWSPRCCAGPRPGASIRTGSSAWCTASRRASS
ncbi:hypothetical protein SVIOM342S_03444 [Streptomyces violaceorubidus]